ncbi:MAG TPA: hypothetical protein VGF70_15495 [Solirubrobacteraceae bacterium]|jgi:hypothetical protein
MRGRRKRFWRTLLEYDSSRRRVWIGGQRCHHGATGSIVATTACARLMTGWRRASSTDRPLVAMALAGWALMAHDWKDRGLWFQRGPGPERL